MKKLLKILIVLFMAVVISGGIGIPAYAQASLIDSGTISVSPLADIIEWRYKVENGLLYKRLFNYTTEQWVGYWILVS